MTLPSAAENYHRQLLQREQASEGWFSDQGDRLCFATVATSLIGATFFAAALHAGLVMER